MKNVGAPGYSRESYLLFDLSQVGSAANITSAKVRLFGNLLNTLASSAAIGLYPVADATWTENGLTWNNKPAAGANDIVDSFGITFDWPLGAALSFLTLLATLAILVVLQQAAKRAVR